MARREFTNGVYAQIVHRAMNAAGHIVCEGCGLVLGKKPYHVDHTIPDALQIDKTRKLTPADGKLLGVDCCHAPKTKVDVSNIARAKRREAKQLGMKKRTGFRKPGPGERYDWNQGRYVKEDAR
jgi:hypothetical protein